MIAGAAAVAAESRRHHAAASAVQITHQRRPTPAHADIAPRDDHIHIGLARGTHTDTESDAGQAARPIATQARRRRRGRRLGRRQRATGCGAQWHLRLGTCLPFPRRIPAARFTRPALLPRCRSPFQTLTSWSPTWRLSSLSLSPPFAAHVPPHSLPFVSLRAIHDALG